MWNVSYLYSGCMKVTSLVSYSYKSSDKNFDVSKGGGVYSNSKVLEERPSKCVSPNTV